MLTDMPHPPLQRLGQGVLGETDLVVFHSVRVEGDDDLSIHDRDPFPVQEHLVVFLPVPDSEEGYDNLPLGYRASPFFSPSGIHRRLERSFRPSVTRGLMSKVTGMPEGCSYLTYLPGFLGSGLGLSGLIRLNRTSPQVPRTGITRAGVRRCVLAKPRSIRSSGSSAVQ